VENIGRRLISLLVVIMALQGPLFRVCIAEEGGTAGFEITTFEITGNSLIPDEKLRATVVFLTGAGKTAADVEKARDMLEKLYHDSGYPAVMVNIPEQTLQDGVVRLQVIESRIGRVKVTGNRYFTMEKVMQDLPSFTPGSILYLPQVQKEISRLNKSQDIKVEPVMTPGKELGSIDVELKVEDQLPFHGYLELNNRASYDTSALRLNGMVRYDNLWQKEHSLSFQYQTAPRNTKEVEVLSGSYVLPAPWQEDDQLALYGIWSDGTTAFGEGFKVIGKGKIFGARYVSALPGYALYTHNLTLGIDYKHFDQTVGFTTEGGDQTDTPISYMPLSFSYGASLPDEWGGMTQFNAGLNLSFRDVGSHERQFELKRYKGRADYVYETVSIKRTQKLPRGLNLLVKVDGQSSDQPLIDSEQFVSGGMESVRGYKESEAAGDEAVHGTVEVSFPNPLEQSGIGKWFQMNPYVFYDLAELTIQEPLPGQTGRFKLEGAGVGMRGSMAKNLEYELDLAKALNATDRTKTRDLRAYFKLKAVF
jgi:hemolysin activation/secretion protein